MKYLISIIVVFLFAEVDMKQKLVYNDLVEETFKMWNEKTISSINDQLTVNNDLRIKSMLKNRVDVLQVTLYSNTANSQGIIDKGMPSRYKFLKALFAAHKIGGKFYVVETVIEGEVVQIKNYLIENNVNTSHITSYYYFKNEWKAIHDTTISKIDLSSELKNVANKAGNSAGVNQSDVILSEFNSSIITSHFYLQSSIKSDNIVSRILNIRY